MVTVLRKSKVLLVSGVTAVAVAGAGIGVAGAADTQTPPPPPPTPPSAPAPPSHHGDILDQIAHGRVTLNGNQHRTVDLQRGTVQEVNPTSVTVRSSDGYIASYALDGNTKVIKNRQPSNIGQLAVNDRVTVVAGVNGTPATATHIADSGPEPSGR